MEFSRLSYQSLPQDPGIYLFLDGKRRILYVGKAKNLKDRVSSYFQNPSGLLEKTRRLVSCVETIRIIRVESEIEALLLEVNSIKKYRPKYNIQFTDSKAYPFIAITKDELPKVLVVRKRGAKDAFYFGPFVHVSDMRFVLRLMRKIFPYQAQRNHPRRFCLYYHLGLCPCPPMFTTEDQKKNYRKTTRHIKSFLKGDSKKLIRELEKERNVFSKQESFEDAERIQRQVEAIKHVTTSFHNPSEYETNPNLLEDLRKEELKDLKDTLARHDVEVNTLNRIECFDVSTISGVLSTGSMVVFIEGEKDPSSYRKFRIRMKQTTGKPNDVAMMEELIKRRLKRKDWERADLMIVDGGKGQVSAAYKAATSLSYDISVVGLAKKKEIMITKNFKEIQLPHDCPAFRLITRIRDEAHRFAIFYHRTLRGKALLA